MRTLHTPVAQISKPVGHNQPHGTPIRRLLSQRSMRAIGKAHDRGIIRERPAA